ncbi:MAG: hypothetical protein ACOCZ9_02365 [Spirochaetota bacterium]
MKRTDIVLWLTLMFVPALLFANAWQAYRYDRLTRAISLVQSEQREAIERNKRHLAGIAALRSPARLDSLARNELELEQNFGGPRLEVVSGNQSSQGTDFQGSDTEEVD